MNANSQTALVVVLLLGLFVMGSTIYTVDRRKRKQFTSGMNVHPSKRDVTAIPKHSSDFYIYNYLTSPILVEILFPDGKLEVLESKINGKSKRGFSWDVIDKYFTPDHRIKISTLEPIQNAYGIYELKTPEGTNIRALHVGMITSRWVGANSDYNIGKPGLNAVQGLPWVRIWNKTDQPIQLNNNIYIPAGEMIRYKGRDHFGVRLGTVFKDPNNIYPDYIFTIPATDIYYGIVSDLQQSLFGGFQLTSEFHDDEYEPQYLLEEGWFYGPAYGHIKYGYIPYDGPVVKPMNRWGEKTDDVKETN